MPLHGTSAQIASAFDRSRITRCGESGQCSEPSKSRPLEACCDSVTCMAFTVLNGIYPDQATPELMELTARLGSMLPYRKTAELLAEFLPIKAAEGHVTGRSPPLIAWSRTWITWAKMAIFPPPGSTALASSC
jgi:hypothetical protein